MMQETLDSPLHLHHLCFISEAQTIYSVRSEENLTEHALGRICTIQEATQLLRRSCISGSYT